MDAQKSLDNISHTAALIPAIKFRFGTYKQAASDASLDPSDAEVHLTNPSLHSAALPTPDAPDDETDYTTPNSPQSGSSSSSSSRQAGDSAASTAASRKASTPLPVADLADRSSDTSSSEPVAPALDLNEAVAESSSAGSAAEMEAHPESVSPTSSSMILLNSRERVYTKLAEYPAADRRYVQNNHAASVLLCHHFHLA